MLTPYSLPPPLFPTVADPYDVLAVQLSGAKAWTVCTPRVGGAALNAAQRCQYQEVLRRRKQGCTSYTDADLARLDCVNLTMTAGDVLYMPKGTVHFARTSDVGSAHLTLSLNRDGAAWGDLLLATLDDLAQTESKTRSKSVSAPAPASASQTGTLPAPGPAPSAARQLRALMRQRTVALSSQLTGLPLLEALPMHLLTPATQPEADAVLVAGAAPLWAAVVTAVLSLDRATLAVLAPAAAYMGPSELRTQLEAVVQMATGDAARQRRILAALARNGRLSQDIAGLGPKPAARSPAAGQTPRRGSMTAAANNLHAMSPWPVFLPMVRERRASCSNCVCNSGCDGSCQITKGCNTNCASETDCDDECDEGCTSGCVGCTTGCDETVCTGDCDGACDEATCYGGCTEGCDELTCKSGCDDSCNAGCDDSCTCNGDCNSSCDLFWVFNCDSSCDSGCGDCKTGCDTCYSGCDDNCTPDKSCDDSCNSDCRLDKGCDELCDSGCTGQSCDDNCAACNENCNTDCDSGCDTKTGCTGGCTLPDPDTCITDCDDTCACVVGSAGNPDAGGDCTPCTGDTYADQPGLFLCRVCGACGAANHYRVGCGGTTAGECVPCGACPAGHYRIDCAVLSAGSCVACPANTYSTTQSTGPCSACADLKCSVGHAREGCGGSSAGTCEPNACPATPPAVAMATVAVSGGGHYPTGRATYTCADGYVLTGSAQLTCDASGAWEGTPPTCVGVACEDVTVEYATVSYTNSQLFPSVASFKCDENHVLHGNPSLSCLPSGQWSSAPPACVPVNDAQDLALECNGTTDNQIFEWLSEYAGVDPGSVCGDQSVTWEHNFPKVRAALSQGCGGNTGRGIVTFTGHDGCDNVVTKQANVTISDETPPSLANVPVSTLVAECNNVPPQAQVGAQDACDTSVTVAVAAETRISGKECASRYRLLRTWNATDACGNTATAQQEVTVTDTAAPTLVSAARDFVVECDASKIAAQWSTFLSDRGGAQATDDCTSVTWAHTLTANDTGCAATVTRNVRFTASDECGQAVATAAAFVVTDSRAPKVETVPATATVECSALQPQQCLQATDACDASPVQRMNETRIKGACPDRYTLLRQWSVEDACGNPTMRQQTVAVDDAHAPVVTVPPSDLELECEASQFQAKITAWLSAHGGAQAEDDCAAVLTWTHNYADVADQLQAGCGGTGQASVTFTVADACGNAATTAATIRVADSIKPVLTAAARNWTVQCDGSGNLAQLQSWLAAHGNASATDACSGAAGLTWSTSTLSQTLCGASERQHVRFTVTDACGLSSSTEADFVIEDTQTPTLVLAGANPQRAEAFFPWGDAGVAGVEDKCHAVDVAVRDVASPPDMMTPGTYSITYTAVDPCGQEGSAVRQVVVADSLPPRITVAGATRLVMRQNSEFGDAGATVQDYPSSAPPATAVSSFSQSSPLNSFAPGVETPGDSIHTLAQTPGEHYIFYAAQDAAGNAAVVQGRIVTVLPASASRDRGKATWTAELDVQAAWPRSAAAVPDVDAATGASATRPVGMAMSFALGGSLTTATARTVLNGTGLPPNLNLACSSVQAGIYTLCMASAPQLSPVQLQALARVAVGVSPQLLPVLGYTGSVVAGVDGASSSSGSTNATWVQLAQHGLQRVGVDDARIDRCAAGVCVYTGASAAPLRDFAVPAVAPARLFWLQLRGRTSASATFVFEALARRGVMPVYFTFSGGSGVAVVRGVWDAAAFEEEGLQVSNVAVSAGTRVQLAVSRFTSLFALRVALLDVAVVPLQLAWATAAAGDTRQAVFTTFSDLLALSQLPVRRGSGVVSVDSVLPLGTTTLPSATAAGRFQYQLRLSDNATLAPLGNATAMLTQVRSALTAAGVTVHSLRTAGDTTVRFGTPALLSTRTQAALLQTPAVDSVTQLTDATDEVEAGVRGALERVLPVDSSRITITAEPVAARSRRDGDGDGSEEEGEEATGLQPGMPMRVTVTVAAPPAADQGAGRYRSTFEITDSVNSMIADDKVLRVLTDLKVRGEGEGGRGVWRRME